MAPADTTPAISRRASAEADLPSATDEDKGVASVNAEVDETVDGNVELTNGDVTEEQTEDAEESKDDA